MTSGLDYRRSLGKGRLTADNLGDPLVGEAKYLGNRLHRKPVTVGISDCPVAVEAKLLLGIFEFGFPAQILVGEGS